MKISKMVIVIGLIFALSLTACAPPEDDPQVPNTGELAQTPDAMMGTDTPDAMMPTATGDVMMEETPDAMLATATGDAMMDETPDAMMTTPTGDAMMDETPDAMMPTPTGEMMKTGTPGAMMEAPESFSTALTDVVTGSTFTINDFKGKAVVVQNVATGCAACLEQGKQLQSLSDMLGSEVVFVGLDGDPQDDAAALKTYVEENGFDGNYAIAPQVVIDEFNSLYGEQFFNASTASILVIDSKGEVHPLEAGEMSAEELKKAIEMVTGM